MTYDWLNPFTIKKASNRPYLAFVVGKMSGKVSRAAKKRQYRAKHKEQYHRLAFIAEYTQAKYNNIYTEAENFYKQLVQKYPNKTKMRTCPEYKAWEYEFRNSQMSDTSSDQESITTSGQRATTSTYEETDIDCGCSTMELSIPLMDTREVQETRDCVMFQNIQPSLLEEISPEILNEVIEELQQSDLTSEIINHVDEDLNEILNDEINATMNELSSLEKELLYY